MFNFDASTNVGVLDMVTVQRYSLINDIMWTDYEVLFSYFRVGLFVEVAF